MMMMILLLFIIITCYRLTCYRQVFFSSCHSVKFHSELLNYIDIEVQDIHGKQKQQKRTTTFFQFCKQEKGDTMMMCL